MISSPEKKNLIYVSLLAVLIFGIYLNSTSGEFVFDDWMLVNDNTMIHYISNWRTILLYSYRPIRTLGLAVIYYFSGKNPVGYHVANISIHILMTMMVFFLARRLSGDSSVGLMAGLVFGTHPVQTDAVSYISGLRDTLSSLLYVGSFYCFVAYKDGRRLGLLAACLGLYVLASLTKEMAVTLVFMVFAYEYFMSMNAGGSPGAGGFLKTSFKTGIRILKENWLFYSSLIVFFLFMIYYYVILRHASGNIHDGKIMWHGGSIYLNYLTIPKIILHYLKQIAFPRHLIADYMFYPIVAKSVYEPQAWAALLIVAAIVASIFMVLRRNALMAFSMAWFFIALLPGLNLLPHHEFMAEHYLYLPMVGVSMVVAVSARAVFKNASSRLVRVGGICVFCALIGVYSVRTVVRNMDWQNDLTLAAQQLDFNPDSPRTLTELGYLYSSMNLQKSAEAKLRRALDITPDYANAYNNLGIVYTKRKEFERAAKAFKTAQDLFDLRLAPTNLGITLMILKDKEKGKAAFLKALEIDPANENALLSLYYYYLLEKDYEKAVEVMRKDIGYRPRSSQLYGLLGQAQLRKFQFKEAVESYETAARLDPGNSAMEKKTLDAKQDLEKWEKVQELKSRGDSGPEKFKLLSEVNMAVGNYEAARSVLEEGLLHHPKDGDLLGLYRQDLIGLGEYDKALAVAKEVESIEKDNVENPLWVARLLAIQLKFEEAQKAADRVASLQPDYAPLQRVMKVISKNLALSERRKKLERVDPDSLELTMIKGDMYLSVGLTKKAMEYYRQLSEDPVYSVDVRYKMAKILMAEKNELSKRDAIKAYREIIELRPKETKAYNALGRIFMDQAEDFETAEDYFQKSLEIDPLQPNAAKSKETIESLDDYIKAVLVDRKYLTPYLKDKEFIQSLKVPHALSTARNEGEGLPDVDGPQ